MEKSKKKQALSIEQMQKLQSLGVDISSASAVWQGGSAIRHKWALRLVGYMDNHLHDNIFTFTLQDIIDLLPTRINHFFDLYIDKDSIGYIDLHNNGKNGDVLIGFTAATCGSLIDAAYMMLEWVVVHKVRTLTKILDLSKSPITNKEEMGLLKNQIKRKEAQTKKIFEDNEKTKIRKKIENIIIGKYPFIGNDELDKSFTMIGFDSIDMVELEMMIEKKFDIWIPDDLWVNVDTVGNAVDVVYKLKKGEQE